jgi:cell division protein ZapA
MADRTGAKEVATKEAGELGQPSVAVEIYDQVYQLRGSDPAYVRGLAAVVDTKMRAVAARSTTVDSLRVAVLAALNLADELSMLREKLQANVDPRAAELSSLLDAVLLDERVAG